MENKITKEVVYRYFVYFLVCAFIGWIFETLAVYITMGDLTYRGYFFVIENIGDKVGFLSNTIFAGLPVMWGLPIIEMYGIGGVLVVMTLKKYRHNLLKLFIYGAIYMTIFELVGSYWCEYVIGKEYWTYDTEFLNFQGRICLQSTIAWGLLSVFVIDIFERYLEMFDNFVAEKKHYYLVVNILMGYTVFCALIKYVIFPNMMVN